MSEGRQKERIRMSERLGILRWLLVLFIFALAILMYLPTPYYVTRPGSAIELAPMIEVEGGKKDEAGAFMLTTVRFGEANPFWYLYAKLSPDAELIDKEQVLNHGETNEEFNQRELAVMENSQKIAEAVAFQLAGYDVKIEKQGVWVMGTLENMPAKNVLQVGDVITAVDGKKTPETKDLLHYFAKKRAGDTVEVTILRDGKTVKKKLTLAKLPDSAVPGIGIRPDNKLRIVVPKKVTIASRGIGGPSAGLMMTLEMYDQLNKEIDLTRGYRVAGTGTISADGTVGRIGGINHKVIAADQAGAEIFFAPDDQTEGLVSNYQEALETAKRIGTSMRVVPVKTVNDALAFLKALPPKK
jgi:PDZ domain-containing protein